MCMYVQYIGWLATVAMIDRAAMTFSDMSGPTGLALGVGAVRNQRVDDCRRDGTPPLKAQMVIIMPTVIP